jgi:hypothetical protein
LKLDDDETLSNIAFDFSLRRYTTEKEEAKTAKRQLKMARRQGLTLVHFSAQVKRF